MKRQYNRLCLWLMILIMLPINLQARTQGEEMRAAWVSTIYNIDYPSTASVGNPTKQKEEYIALLDNLEAIGMNTVFVQVRPKADAFYRSTINPWSDILTGTQGKDPGYDPMAFMIEEAHARGFEFHAWLNPYRVTTTGTDVNALAATHPARLHPEWTIAYNDKLYYNPELDAVQQHIVDTVAEIIMRYDVDGIHFDDYFYPSYYPLPEGEDKDGPVANARREHINDMVKKVSQTVAAIKPDVDFGISPLGIWKNKKSDSQGSNTTGGEGYYSVFADATKWVEEGWIDYIIPQIYWERGHNAADYNTLVKWWANLVEDTDVDLYIGQGIYKDTIASDIAAHLLENTKYDAIKGNAYFSAKDLVNNRQGIATTLTTLYQEIGPDVEPDVEADKTPDVVPDVEADKVPDVESDVAPDKVPDVVVPEPTRLYKKGSVTTEGLNVRSGPDTSYSSIGKLAKGTNVKIWDVVGGGWFSIELQDGTKGYVSGTYIAVSTEIRLVVGNKQVEPTVAPVLKEGTTLVPLRIISEELGATVAWEPTQKQATIKRGNTSVQVSIGQKTAFVNGVATEVPLAPELIQDTTMVPVRFIAEALGIEITWESLEKVVNVKL